MRDCGSVGARSGVYSVTAVLGNFDLLGLILRGAPAGVCAQVCVSWRACVGGGPRRVPVAVALSSESLLEWAASRGCKPALAVLSAATGGPVSGALCVLARVAACASVEVSVLAAVRQLAPRVCVADRRQGFLHAAVVRGRGDWCVACCGGRVLPRGLRRWC
jgi:hypothetical protein